jgi:hypothetical protein
MAMLTNLVTHLADIYLEYLKISRGVKETDLPSPGFAEMEQDDMHCDYQFLIIQPGNVHPLKYFLLLLMTS